MGPMTREGARFGAAFARLASGLGLLSACGPAPTPLRERPNPAPGVSFDAVCDPAHAVPMEVAGSRHFVEIELPSPRGGPARLRFHVDTGGNTRGLLLDKETAESLGFRSDEDLPRRVRIGGRAFELPEGADWTLAPLSRRARKNFSVGQLGAGFLSRFLVCFDAPNGRLVLREPTDPGPSPARGLAEIPLTLRELGRNRALYPFLGLRFTGGAGRASAVLDALLDTGAAASFLEDLPDTPWALGLRPVRGAAGDADMIGGAFEERMALSPSVQLSALGGESPIPVGASLFVSRPRGAMAGAFGGPPSMRDVRAAVGNDVWNRFRFVVDYRRARLVIEVPNAGAVLGTRALGNTPRDTSALDVPRVGVSLSFDDDGCPVVRRISDTNDERTRGALQLGDRVLEIDGRDACRLWHHEIGAALSGAGDKRVKLQREGVAREVTLAPARLF